MTSLLADYHGLRGPAAAGAAHDVSGPPPPRTLVARVAARGQLPLHPRDAAPGGEELPPRAVQPPGADRRSARHPHAGRLQLAVSDCEWY